jgi:hypothetical protein
VKITRPWDDRILFGKYPLIVANNVKDNDEENVNNDNLI